MDVGCPAKIADLYDTAMEDNVLGFQIPVDDVVAVHKVEPTAELVDYAAGFGLGEALLAVQQV